MMNKNITPQRFREQHVYQTIHQADNSQKKIETVAMQAGSGFNAKISAATDSK